jgi:hypothetical protein
VELVIANAIRVDAKLEQLNSDIVNSDIAFLAQSVNVTNQNVLNLVEVARLHNARIGRLQQAS